VKKARIFHLEDDPEWVDHVSYMLGDDYDVYTASNLEEAAKLFVEMGSSEPKLKFDLAVIDISLILGVPHDKRNVSSIVRQLLLEFREQLLSLTRRWPVSHTSVV